MDPRLDRQVAIKVLPPDLTRDDTAKQRFLQEAMMTPKNALDAIVSGLAEIDAGLSGDDSSLADTWEDIKDQLQHEPSGYWPMCLETMHQFVAGLVSGLEGDDLSELQAALKCSSHKALEQKLMQRLLARGKKEKIRLYPDFPKSTNTLYLYILRAKLSVRPAQVDGIYVNIISHGSTPARTRACSDTTPRPDALYRALSRLDAVSDQAHVNVTHCQI